MLSFNIKFRLCDRITSLDNLTIFNIVNTLLLKVFTLWFYLESLLASQKALFINGQIVKLNLAHLNLCFNDIFIRDDQRFINFLFRNREVLFYQFSSWLDLCRLRYVLKHYKRNYYLIFRF